MRNVWDEQEKKIVQVPDDDPQFDAPAQQLPRVKEKRIKHVLFFDKATGRVCGHMAASEDHCDVEAIQRDHHRPDAKIGCRVLKSRKFAMPDPEDFGNSFRRGSIPEDLMIEDIDPDTDEIKGKYRRVRP